MSLENLVKIKQLQHHTATAHEVARLLAAAQASLADASNASLSDASRFDLAYKSIMQCAMAQDTKSGAGQYFTPRALIQWIVPLSLPIARPMSLRDWPFLQRRHISAVCSGTSPRSFLAVIPGPLNIRDVALTG